MKIASLLPSATEILCALGLGDQLVGVSHECDFPESVRGLPVLTEAKLDATRESAIIDAEVRRLVRDGLGVYRIKSELLAELQPDLIVTQDQCDVCAVSYADVVAATRSLLGGRAEIVSLKPQRLEDILSDCLTVARAAHVEAAGEQLVTAARQRLDTIRQKMFRVRSRPRVACIEWLDPLMMAGNWIPEMVELAGGTYGAVESGVFSPTISWEQLVEYAPDVLILMPCGFGLAQTERELPRLTAHPLWSSLPAVRNRRVYAVDGNAYLNRPGPRIVDSAELLAGLIQPGLYAHMIPAGSYTRVGG